MFNNIKKYFSYRKNLKTAKREFMEIASYTLPVANTVLKRKTDIADFIVKLTDEAKGIEGEELIKMVLSEISFMLETNNERLVEILKYIVTLSPNDMHKILVHGIVESNKKD